MPPQWRHSHHSGEPFAIVATLFLTAISRPYHHGCNMLARQKAVIDFRSSPPLPCRKMEDSLVRLFCTMTVVAALLCSPALAQPTKGLTASERMQAQPVMMAAGLVAGARECHAQGFSFTTADLARVVAHANATIQLSGLDVGLINRAVGEVEEMARTELASGHLDNADCLKVREGVRLLASDVALDPAP